MKARMWFGSVVLAAILASAIGCGRAVSAFQNMNRKDSSIKIWLDGQAAAQDGFEKAKDGYARFKITEQVSTSPKLKFELDEAEKFGRITMVQSQIHQKFEADYSHQAEFVVISKDTSTPEAQMKPGTEYDLGKPGDQGLRILDLNGKDVSAVTLKPGMEYMLSFSVKADHSETVNVYFKTK